MKVYELISILEKVNPNGVVEIFDLLHDTQKTAVRFVANADLAINSDGKPKASFAVEDDGHSFFRIYVE